MPPSFGQHWIRPCCQHKDVASTQPYTSGAQTLLQHAHRDTASDRNCNLIHTPSSKFAGAVRAPVKSCMRNSVQSMYFSLIAGEGEERKEILSTADCNGLATCILETPPWAVPALSVIYNCNTDQENIWFVVQFLGQPVHIDFPK